MSRIGKIICYGYRYPAKEWPCENLMGIHRLYHIHGGNGGCRHNGTDCPFLPGRIYFIPFSEDFEPYSDSDDPILHSYVDFELIPPLCTDRILSANPRNSGTAEAALAVFDAGARERGGKIAPTAPVAEDTPFGRDVVGEVAAACKKHGLKLGLYYSQELDWHEPDGGGYLPEKLNVAGMHWTNNWDFPKDGEKNYERCFPEKDPAAGPGTSHQLRGSLPDLV